MEGLALISEKFGDFGENVAQRAAREEPALYGELAPGVLIHIYLVLGTYTLRLWHIAFQLVAVQAVDCQRH